MDLFSTFNLSGPQACNGCSGQNILECQLHSMMVVLESLGSCDQRLIQLNDIKEHHSCNVVRENMRRGRGAT